MSTMQTDFDERGLGDNRRTLSLNDQLVEDTAQTRLDVEALAERANKAPKAIKTPDDLNTVGMIVVDARKLWKRTDSERANAKEPFLASERIVQTFYSVFLDRLKRISETFQKIGDDYQTEQARLARAKAQIEADAARAEELKQRDLAALAALEAAPKAGAEVKATAKADAAGDRAYAAEAVVAQKSADLVRTRTESGVLASANSCSAGTCGSW